MKTTYKSLFIIGLSIVSLGAMAQKDSTITRQVLLERDYNPTLQDASKINTMPSIYSPVIKAKDFKFISTSPRVTLSNNQLGSAGSGDIKTNVDYSKKRGYLNLGAGTNSNLDGAFGYRLVQATRDRLDISATHTSTSSNLNYKQDQFLLKEAKAKYSASKVKLQYQHIFDPSILLFDAGFYTTGFNYYGNTFILPIESANTLYDLTSRQNVDVISVGAGLRSSDKNGGELKYIGNLTYHNFKTKYGIIPDEKGPKGGQLDLNLNLFAELESDKTVGVRASIMNQSVSKSGQFINGNTYHGFTNITGNPYVKFQGSSWDADLGVNVNGLFDQKTKFFFSPNLKAQVHIQEVNTLYAEVGGGINNNTILDILQENRYASPAARIAYSKTVVDAKIGFKSGIVSGLEFDLFAGYKKTNDDHLYFPYYSIDPASVPSKLLWGNVSTPLYADVSTGHIGGLLKTNLIPYTDLSAKVTGYFYTVKYGKDSPVVEKTAWGRPTFTAELNADIKPIDNFTLSLNYLLAGGRKAYFLYNVTEAHSLRMKNVNELNIKGEYQITDWVSVNARLNNVLSQKYELQYGYTLQGFNVLGGLNFKF